MSIKLYKCECEFAVFPFGNGLPICIREFKQIGMKPCIEKGCEHYKKFEKTEKKGDRNEQCFTDS